MIIVPAETGQPMEASDFTGCFVIFGDFSGLDRPVDLIYTEANRY